MLSYINSPKFNCGDSLDRYVNTKDIENRIRQIQSNMFTESI